MDLREIRNLVNEASHEIKDLRKDNEKMAIELGAYNRLFSALEAHRPIERSVGMSEDVVFKLNRAEEKLNKELDAINGINPSM